MLSRRNLLTFGINGLSALCLSSSVSAGQKEYLLGEIPASIEGDWGQMYKTAAIKVINRARATCLTGVRQVSDRQPRSLKVERHTSGPPAIWLHSEPADEAWIIVNFGERDWSKLAYQFGHELGHVMANSWAQDGRVTSASTCQWVEEAAAEALSINGLRQLRVSWARIPPFPGDSAFGASLDLYYNDIRKRYNEISKLQADLDDLGAWFLRNRLQLETETGLNDAAKAFSLILLDLYTQHPESIEAIGALNRWPERAALPIDRYLSNWTRSCSEIGADTYLPRRLQSLLKI